MSNQFLKLRRSAVPGRIPTTASLDFGEIAINTYDGLAFLKKSGLEGEMVIAIGSTGSLYGTASWANNALVAPPFSYVDTTIYSTNPMAGPDFSMMGGFFVGEGAGMDAMDAYDSTFIGMDAGIGGIDAFRSVFIGHEAGSGSFFADNSVFIGHMAGIDSPAAFGSNFIGFEAGHEANFAFRSNFIGYNAGFCCYSASYSTIIGYRAGYVSERETSPGINNIIIGTNITLPVSYDNGINIGGIIFGSGSYSNLFLEENAYSGSAGGRIGINQTDPQYELDVFGDGNYSGDLTVTGSIIGTASWAQDALTAYFITGSGVYGPFGSNSVLSASYAVNAATSSYSVSASYIIGGATTIAIEEGGIPQGSVGTLNFTGSSVDVSVSTGVATINVKDPFPYTGSALISGSLVVSGSVTTTEGFTGSLLGSSSYALTASFALNGGGGGSTFPYTGDAVISGSLIVTGSTTITGTLTAQTLHVQYITASTEFITGSTKFGTQLTDTHQFTGSVTITGSLGILGPITDVDYIQFNTSASSNNEPGKLVWNDNDGTLNLGMKGGNVTLQMGQEFLTRVHNLEPTTLTDGQLVAFSGSVGDKIGVKLADATLGQEASNIIGMVTEQILPGEEGFVTYRGFVRDLNTTLYLAGEMLYLDTVPGGYNNTPADPPNASAAIGYAVIIDAVTGSIYVDIKPHLPLGGIDDVLDNTTSASYGDLLVKSGSVWTNSKQLTGSYGLTGSLTISGSLNATSSWAQNAVTASYVLNAVSSSFAATASFVQTAQTASYVLNAISSSFASTASFVTLAQTASFVTLAQTASFVQTAQTASFVTTAQTASFVTTAQTASFVATASWAQNARTASFITGSNVWGPFGSNSVISSSYSATASFATTASYVLGGASQVTVQDEGAGGFSAGTLNFVGAGVTVSNPGGGVATINIPGAGGTTFPYTGSAIISGSLLVTGSVSVTQGGFTGSLLGTASWAENAVTASFITASNVYGPYGSNSVLTASYAFTSSYAVNLIVSGGLTNLDYIDFDTASAATMQDARLKWDDGEGTLQLGLKGNVDANIGEQLYQYVHNAEATTLTKGTVVYVSGSQGGRIAVKRASATAEGLSAETLGLAAEDILSGTEGWVITDGSLRGVNTSGLIGGRLIFLSSSAGEYTQEYPQAPLHGVRLGYVQKVDASPTQGILYIKIDNGYELDELHDVKINGATSGDLLLRSASLWINTKQLTGSYGLTGSLTATSFTGSLFGTASYALDTPPAYIDNYITVGLPGSDVQYNSIKTAVDSITDAAVNNTYTVKVYPGVYIEDSITVPSYVAIKGDSSTSTIVSASSTSNTIFVMSDQSMLIDMQIQGSTATGAKAVYYASSTTPQRNAIAYVENVRFGTNYTNAVCEGLNGANIILQCSNVKYGGYTDDTLQKSFDIGFLVTGSNSGIGRMQLRNVTSTNGGVAGSSQDQVFALAAAPSCTFIVNGCLLTRATGAATGTGFKVYNGGQLRLTAVNFQRWTRGIWAPQTGSAPSIDAIALNFENCTTDVAIEHTGSIGKVQGTDTFLKTQIALDAPLYEVGQDPRRITVAKKGGDFTSISASVAYITDSAENNRYVIEIGPGEFTEKQIDMSNKPYVALLGSDIQTTVIVPSGSGAYDQLILGPTNEISFLSFKGNSVSGYSAITTQNLGADFSQAHKVSIYDYDYGIKVLANTADTTFYGEYVDINGSFSYGVYVSSSAGNSAIASIENYYLFPSASSGVGNYATGPSSSLNLYTCLFEGDSTAGSTAITIERGATLEAIGIDVPNWDYGVKVPNTSPAPNFRIVGSMFHESVTYDFEVLNASTTGRFQGVSSHTKISNASQDFYWNFLDDLDGENDITRNLAVTFADGTHTDASTLIFKGSPMGVMQGGEITISGSLTITTAAGFGYLQDTIDTEVYKRIDWVNTNLTLTANTNNYIYLNDNGILSAAGSSPDSETNIILGRVVTNDTGIELIDQSPYNGEHMSNKLSLFNREALGPVFAEGSIVTEDVTPFKLDVTQGTYFFSENKFTPIGTSSINLTQYYQSASVWARYTSSVVPNNVYASGSALVAMSASYYTKHTVYLVGDGVDEEYFLVVNDNQYSSLVATENANLPTIPTYFNDGVVPLAAVYVQSGSANITQIQDIRPIIGFRAAGVNASSVHGNLLGLTADDHLQYLRVDGFREMTGDFGLGGNDIYNVGYVSASEFRGPLANITTINATSVTASFNGNLTGTASTASYVLQAISASFATSAATASFVTLAQTASFVATASWARNAITASYVTGSIFTSTNPALSASYALTASYALSGGSAGSGLATKAGSIANTSFTGNPRKAIVTFAAPFANTNYGVVITGEDARTWTVEGKLTAGFTASANSNTGLAGTTYWIATAYGETT